MEELDEVWWHQDAVTIDTTKVRYHVGRKDKKGQVEGNQIWTCKGHT